MNYLELTKRLKEESEVTFRVRRINMDSVNYPLP